DRLVSRESLRFAGPQVEDRAVSGAGNGAFLLVKVALRERSVVMRAAIFDAKERASTVQYGEKLALVLDDLAVSGLEFRDRADGNLCLFFAHVQGVGGGWRTRFNNPQCGKPRK